MELHIKDRIYIPQILPKEGNFKSFSLKREILKKVGLTDDDANTYEIKEDNENNRITWNVEKDNELPLIVDFTKEEVDFLKNACESLVDANFPDDFWLVVEKIYDASNE